LSQAQTFVLRHAIAGVPRTLAASDKPPPLREIDDALVHSRWRPLRPFAQPVTPGPLQNE
jgi:hypothetical protein